MRACLFACVCVCPCMYLHACVVVCNIACVRVLGVCDGVFVRVCVCCAIACSSGCLFVWMRLLADLFVFAR